MCPIDLNKIRHYLHQNPELSGKEKNTHDFIVQQLESLHPIKIYKNLGGYGVAASFGRKKGKKTVMFRCDTDALPIEEKSGIPYKSRHKNIAHLCGHDGHTTMMLGFAEYLSVNNHKIESTVVLLFQPAEETAAGAKAVMADEQFNEIEPDYIFGMHNLPGFPLNEIILRKGIFSSASKGMIFKFTGATSHAAHPENGRNPSQAIAQLIQSLYALPAQYTGFNAAALITIIHVKIGEVAFGTSAGEGVLMATFRSHGNKDMATMTGQATKIAENLATSYGLALSIEEVEIFPATENDNTALEIVKKSAKNLKRPVKIQEQPFPWSEDFGFFTQKYKGCFWGIGSGLNHSQLHNHDYDFPDEILESGIDILIEILKNMEKL